VSPLARDERRVEDAVSAGMKPFHDFPLEVVSFAIR
jgi:hypothetical protein